MDLVVDVGLAAVACPDPINKRGAQGMELNFEQVASPLTFFYLIQLENIAFTT